MARYKIIDRSPKFIPVVLDAQLIPGSFEYALDFLVDNELDLSRFDARYKNDETGAPAYSPAVMIKIVLLAYSRGLITSRDIERVCRENFYSWRSRVAGHRSSLPLPSLSVSSVLRSLARLRKYHSPVIPKV